MRVFFGEIRLKCLLEAGEKLRTCANASRIKNRLNEGVKGIGGNSFPCKLLKALPGQFQSLISLLHWLPLRIYSTVNITCLLLRACKFRELDSYFVYCPSSTVQLLLGHLCI